MVVYGTGCMVLVVVAVAFVADLLLLVVSGTGCCLILAGWEEQPITTVVHAYLLFSIVAPFAVSACTNMTVPGGLLRHVTEHCFNNALDA
jgi:hypothetical protein